MLHFTVNWLAGTPSFAAPYALAALGLIVSERAGVLSLGAEGFMLVGALAGVATELELGGYPGIALLVAMLAAAVVSLLFAFLVVFLRVNQVIAGLAVVFFCHGLTSLVGTLGGWTNRAITGMHAVAIWPLSEIPIVGKILFTQDRRRLSHDPDLLSGQLCLDPIDARTCDCARSAKIRRPRTPPASACRSTGSARSSPARR